MYFAGSRGSHNSRRQSAGGPFEYCGCSDRAVMINISQQAANPWSKPTRQRTVHHLRKSRTMEPCSQIHCRTDWMLRDEFLEKGRDTSCHDFFFIPSLVGFLVGWLFFILLQKIGRIIICSAYMIYWFLLTMVTVRPWMWGLTLWWEGPQKENREQFSISPFIPSVCVCIFVISKRKNLWQFLLLFFNKCRAVQKKWGLFFFPILAFTKAHAFLFLSSEFQTLIRSTV